MVSTPNKTSNKTVNDTKSNIMSQYQGLTDSTLFGSLQTKPGDYESVGSVMNGSVVNFIDFLSGEELILGDTSQVGTPAYEQYTSSNTPSSLVYDISTPRDVNDSFLSTDSFYSNDSFYNDSFNSTDSPMINASFLSSPLDPALDFFPDLIDSDASRSLVQLTTGIPSVTIPVDDSPLTTVPSSSALSPALTIPWSTDATISSSTETIHASSPSILSNYSSATSSPKTPSTVVSNKTSPQTTSSSPLKSNTRSRKRSISETEKDSQSTADELALKRAKNTDAARRSRLRKVMRMETLEKQVAELKAENTDLQTRIAVLESEKKGLEEKNAEKEGRVKMLEQHLAEAHERLIKRT